MKEAAEARKDSFIMKGWGKYNDTTDALDNLAEQLENFYGDLEVIKKNKASGGVAAVDAAFAKIKPVLAELREEHSLARSLIVKKSKSEQGQDKPKADGKTNAKKPDL